MNVKLLRKVKKHILEEPKRLYMSWFIVKKSEDRGLIHRRKFPECGTAACIAGWTCLLNGKEFPTTTSSDWFFTAEQLLGISRQAAVRLFVPGYWPTAYKGGVNNNGRRKTALIAAARIEHFIKTKGRE